MKRDPQKETYKYVKAPIKETIDMKRELQIVVQSQNC